METNKTSIDFANFNYAYGDFQQQYKIKCEKVSTMNRSSFVKVAGNPIKLISSMIYEYLVFVKSPTVKNEIIKKIRELENEIEKDKDYKKLSETKNKNGSESSTYNKKYYKYIIQLYKIIGNYGDELTTTFMPNKSDRKKIVRYINTNSFFEYFTRYKSEASEKLSEFTIINFKSNFTYFLGFYFAYYLFVDELTRQDSEKILNTIIKIYTTEEISNILIIGTSKLSKTEKNLLKTTDRLMHQGIIKVFLKINESYSNYGVIPKIEEKINFDDTLI